MSHATSNLPTLQQIRREHSITSRAIAEEAGVDFRTEYLLEIGAAVEHDDALKVLHALSTLSGERCAVDTVRGMCIVTASTIEGTTGRGTGL